MAHVCARDQATQADLQYNQRHKPSADERAAEIPQSLDETLGDSLIGLNLMIERAQENLPRCKAKQPVVGHLLPYLTEEEAKHQGMGFDEELGWVEVRYARGWDHTK